MTFARFARDLARMSTCSRASVGAVIFPANFSAVHAIGYNSPPAGSPNASCTGQPGECGCVHAEANVIAKLDSSLRGLVMISTTFPCWRCAGLIVNCGAISVVAYDEDYRCDRGARVLDDGDVQMIRLKDIRDAHLLKWRTTGTGRL